METLRKYNVLKDSTTDEVSLNIASHFFPTSTNHFVDPIHKTVTMSATVSELPNNSLMPDKQCIKLEPEQASLTPFPPGCHVVVMDGARIECSGEVTSVYVSFARNSGSCDNSYRVVTEKARGETCSKIVPGSQLRYAIDCPIKITPPEENEAIDGVIKGFEVHESSENFSASFSYTVEVSAFLDNGQCERKYRHRGIGPEHIRFRSTPSRQHYYDDGKTSVISFDENSTSSKDDPSGRDATSGSRDFSNNPSPNRSLEPSTGSNFPRKNISIDTTSPSPKGSQSSPFFIQDPPTEKYSSPYNGPVYRSCVPLPSPIPNKFLGDMEKFKNNSVVDFSALVNFPSSGRNQMLPEGTKTCVMCGEIRPTCLKNKKKGSTQHCSGIIIPNQNKGLCTDCDVQIWVIRESGHQIKWCKGCKNFQHWACFGDKGGATKCTRCRDRQREKYAASKLEKELKRKAKEQAVRHLALPYSKKSCQ